MNLEEWLTYGKQHGFFSEFCAIHDAPPMNDSEADAYYSDLEPCIPAARIWFY